MKFNDNCLAGYRCPKCGGQGPFIMPTKCAMRWTDDGPTDEGKFPMNACVDQNEDLYTLCESCNHHAPTTDFDAAKAYVKGGGTRCPYCDSEDVGGKGVHVNVGTAVQDMGCDECGAEWTDAYELTGMHAFPYRDFGKGDGQ